MHLSGKGFSNNRLKYLGWPREDQIKFFGFKSNQTKTTNSKIISNQNKSKHYS